MPSIPAPAHDCSAAIARSRPIRSSPVADAHRQSGPTALARATASSGPGGCLSQTPPAANPDSSSSRSLAAPSAPSKASHGPKTLSPSPPAPGSAPEPEPEPEPGEPEG